VGGIGFSLSTKAGRKCLSAEDFLNQAISQDWFDPILTYGINEDGFKFGDQARRDLAKSFTSDF